MSKRTQTTRAAIILVGVLAATACLGNPQPTTGQSICGNYWGYGDEGIHTIKVGGVALSPGFVYDHCYVVQSLPRTTVIMHKKGGISGSPDCQIYADDLQNAIDTTKGAASLHISAKLDGGAWWGLYNDAKKEVSRDYSCG